MAVWKCPDCGYEKDSRCKPKNCPDCAKPVAFGKKDEAACAAPAKAAPKGCGCKAKK